MSGEELTSGGHRPAAEMPPLLRAEGLTKMYSRRRGGDPVVALDGADLVIAGRSIVALVGESGSGKSTLARCLALLERPTSGEIRLEGEPLSQLPERRRAALRPRLQLIFQDPAAAINPRFSALETVGEPLRLTRRGDRAARRRRALGLMAEVGLDPELAARSSLELSGGQRQRLAIARALAAEPKLLILDEGLSGLDLSLSAQIVNLLLDLRQRHDLTYLMISHDLRLVAHLADEVAVMHRGRIVEHAAPGEVWQRPRHAVTRALIEAGGRPWNRPEERSEAAP